MPAVAGRRHVLVTSSFTGWTNYMMDFGKMLKDPEAMKHFGNTVAIWDLHARKLLKIFDVPGAPMSATSSACHSPAASR